MPTPPPPPPPPVAHTYVAGEDEGRLAAAAQQLGLHRTEGRLPKTSWANLLLNDNTLTSARMHSVGYLARDERVDEYGTLHLMSVRRRTPATTMTTTPYHRLTDLFATPSSEEGLVTTVAIPPLEEEEERRPLREQEEEEDLMVEDMVEGGSLVSAVFGIIKGTVGPAILYLPRGFYASGYAVAVPAMMFATGMFIFNAYRLLDCWKVESDKHHQVAARLQEVQALLQQAGGGGGGNSMEEGGGGGGVTNHADSLALLQKSPQFGKFPKKHSNPQLQQYGATEVQQIDTAFTAKMLTYPELAKRALGKYSVVVELGIALFQFGVCLTYLIFVPDNLRTCAYAMTGYRIPKVALLWMMILVEIPLCGIRDIRRLTTTNVIASFLILMGLVSVLVIAVQEGTTSTYNAETHEDEWVFVQNLRGLQPLTESWFLFIGTSFFMMEGSITLLVPLQEAVYRPEDRDRFPDMNRNVTAWICVFYVVFSAIACAAFGSHIQTALTASLTGKLATFVQLAYSIAVMLTFPLQAFPAMEVAIRMMHAVTGSTAADDAPHDDSKQDWHRNIFATTIVLLLGVIAVCAIDYLGNVVSILGSLFGIPLALVFPPLMHNSLVKDSSPMTRWTNYAVVVVGFFAMAAASFNTIVTWDQGAEG